MTPEERLKERLKKKILKLEEALESLQVKNSTLKLENNSLIKSLRADDNGEYIYYLQRTLKTMEALHVEQNKTIEAYIKHFNRFRTVYESKQTETMI